ITPKEYSIGYLPQEEVAVRGTSILQAVLEGQKELKELEKKIEDLHEELTATDQNREDLLEQLGMLEHRYEAMDGYHLEQQAKTILSGLGFQKDDFARPLSEFSGGWRMRVYLALLLVLKPDLLLLDEPTNHLDLPSLEWLEQYLLSFPGSIIAVSHDRFFIDRLAQEIVELNRGKLQTYPGSYHKFEELKEQNDALLLKKWNEQKSERERQERFVNRFRYKNTKARQVQSKIKQLEKMAAVEVQAPPESKPRLDFTLSVEVTSYNDVLTVEKMFFKYDRDWVLKNIDLNIYRGDKVSLVGPNGAGKTTFTKLIYDQLQPQQGILRLGERTVIGYYAQHQVDALDLEATVYEEVSSTVATGLVPKIRDVLGVFQFTGQDVYKKIKVLSGGEKARVSLAKILISPVNFLIMDEPTNHLDKGAREALERALSKYNGTLLLISHDRYFLDKLVNRVVEIRDGQVLEYDGNYSYFLQKRDAMGLPVPGSVDADGRILRGPASNQPQEPVVKKTKKQKRLEAQARQAVSKERNKLKKNVAVLEEKIDQLEARKEELEAQLAESDTYQQGELAVTLQKEYGSICKDLESSNRLWEEALSQLEALETSIL
ncbi:MAG: ABC-F family ATP-binding cassette domain-containing protein, partial [bacterium]|nr:ABC-F family ATP-binding cassette domain-containing protein [bacterium]